MPAPLPVEVLELILGYLHPLPLHPRHAEANFVDRKTARTLASCALVCRTWLGPARRILFYRLKIVRDKAHAFARLFPFRAGADKRAEANARVTFLPYIRELHFTRGIAGSRWMDTVFQRRISASVQRFVKTLCLHGEGLEIPTTLPLTGFTAVTRLEISGRWHVPLRNTLVFIAGFPALRDLLFDTSDDLEGSPAEEGVVPPASLRRIACKRQTSYPVFNWIRQALPCGIEALQFSIPNNGDSERFVLDALEYIAAQGPSLESLSLSIAGGGRHWYFRDPFTALKFTNAPFANLATAFLQTNRNLKHLTLDMGKEFPPFVNPSIDLLRSAADSRSLRNLNTLGLRNLAGSTCELDSTLAHLPSECRVTAEMLFAIELEGASMMDMPACVAQGIKVDFTRYAWDGPVQDIF